MKCSSCKHFAYRATAVRMSGTEVDTGTCSKWHLPVYSDEERKCHELLTDKEKTNNEC